MNNKLSKIKYIAIFLTGISAASIPATASADWSIIGLGTLGGISSGARDINDSGQVVGSYLDADGYNHAFITGLNGAGITGIVMPDGVTSSAAYGINSLGQVAGVYITEDEIWHAYFTGNNGIGVSDFGSSISSRISAATDINDSGDIVGWFVSSDYAKHAFISDINGVGAIDLGTAGLSSDAQGINNSGQVLVNSEIPVTYATHAFISGNNGINLTDIGTLGGISSGASDINNSGQVVGGSPTSNSGNVPHAFLTDTNGTGMMDLGTLGGIDSFSQGINDLGEVVGTSSTAHGEYHSFIYSHGGITDISLLAPVVADGWESLVAVDLNNNGQIVGWGTNSLGIQEAFLLSYTPDTTFDPQPIFIPSLVPEPETYAMLLAGLGLLGFMARRRKESAV